MNDPFMHEQSANFAKRLASLGGDATSQIAAAHELAYCRPPTPAEVDAALAFIEKYEATLARPNAPEADRPAQALAAYVRTMLSSNEFFFLD
jgi:hypothetical protein